MNPSVIITCGVLATIVAATLAYRRRRELAAQRTWAGRHGWDLEFRCDELRDRLDFLQLLRIGHSRRVTRAFKAAGPTYLCEYTFETGVENRRRQHSWLIVSRQCDHDITAATFTSLGWLRDAARPSAIRVLPIPGSENETERVALVRDEREWADRLGAGLGRWMARQPAGRNWDVREGFVVGYEPGKLRDDALTSLVADSAELADRLLEPQRCVNTVSS